jgi:hypothetical protein
MVTPQGLGIVRLSGAIINKLRKVPFRGRPIAGEKNVQVVGHIPTVWQRTEPKNYITRERARDRIVLTDPRG